MDEQRAAPQAPAGSGTALVDGDDVVGGRLLGRAFLGRCPESR